MQTTTEPSAAVSAHTPGPWFHTALGVHRISICSKKPDWPASEAHATVWGLSREESDANARLIAAAPDLLGSLLDIIASADANDTRGIAEALNDARVVVARATGR